MFISYISRKWNYSTVGFLVGLLVNIICAQTQNNYTVSSNATDSAFSSNLTTIETTNIGPTIVELNENSSQTTNIELKTYETLENVTESILNTGSTIFSEPLSLNSSSSRAPQNGSTAFESPTTIDISLNDNTTDLSTIQDTTTVKIIEFTTMPHSSSEETIGLKTTTSPASTLFTNHSLPVSADSQTTPSLTTQPVTLTPSTLNTDKDTTVEIENVSQNTSSTHRKVSFSSTTSTTELNSHPETADANVTIISTPTTTPFYINVTSSTSSPSPPIQKSTIQTTHTPTIVTEANQSTEITTQGISSTSSTKRTISSDTTTSSVQARTITFQTDATESSSGQSTWEYTDNTTAVANTTSVFDEDKYLEGGWTRIELILVLGITFILNAINIIIVVCCVYKITRKRYHWDRPPLRYDSRVRFNNAKGTVECIRAIRGTDLASDEDCTADEKTSAETIPVITKDAGWCVPYNESKKPEKNTEDTGV